MTRRNDKRNNRRNRQRNNTTELPPFAQMLFGAILGKGVDMIAKKMAENNEETPYIHAKGISNQDVTNINNGKATLSKLRIPADGSAVEYHIPDNLQFFFDEEGKLMVRQKTEHENVPKNEEGNPITYDDILKKLYLNKTAYWACGEKAISQRIQRSREHKDSVNCTSEAQVRRMAAFNKLQNIAKYLNNGWKPNFKDAEQKWFIAEQYFGEYQAKFTYSVNYGIVYFKSEDLVLEAIRLMGKDSLNDLFSTNW